MPADGNSLADRRYLASSCVKTTHTTGGFEGGRLVTRRSVDHRQGGVWPDLDRGGGGRGDSTFLREPALTPSVAAAVSVQDPLALCEAKHLTIQRRSCYSPPHERCSAAWGGCHEAMGEWHPRYGRHDSDGGGHRIGGVHLARRPCAYSRRRGAPDLTRARSRELVVLVDNDGTAIGTAEKMHVHRTGQLHRAVSVFLFDARGRMWLQRRARHKYHSPGLWSNACCTHPRPREAVAAAATRRVREELGAECSRLRPLFSFVYYAPLGDGLVEHEYDHVFAGRLDVEPTPDPREVDAVRAVPLTALLRKLHARPECFTPWLRMAAEPVMSAYGRRV